MKIRQGFVSNSSSSSFIVAKVFLSEEQIKGLRNSCKALKEKEPNGWDDSGGSWYEDDNYFEVHTYYVWNEVDKMLKELKIDESKLFHSNY
jgi:hypothetical protein